MRQSIAMSSPNIVAQTPIAGCAVTMLTGRVALLPGSDVLSGISNTPIERAVRLKLEDLQYDEQADSRVHGGPEKALHYYPGEHYAIWQSELGSRPALQSPGGFGENISGFGLTEGNVAVGDIFRLGTALIQVSQGRQPCWKLNHRFGVPGMARLVQQSGRTGWYFRVLEPGVVASGDRLTLIERRAPDWTLHRIWHAFYVDRLNGHELAGIAGLAVLSEGWRNHATRRLQSGQVEDWSKRLERG